MLIDKNQPCTRWELRLILEIHPGDDGVVRVVIIKTATGIFQRNEKTLFALAKM